MKVHIIKITIITVARNAEKTIERTILSVLSQTYQNIEYIVWDGASTDKTLKILNKYKKKLSLIISQKDDGPADAINKSLRYASGSVVGFLNSDDYFFDSNVISIIAKKMKNEKIDAVFGDMNYVNRHDQLTRKWKASDYYEGAFLKGWSIPFPTFYLKKIYYDKYGGLNQKYKICDDLELVFRMIYINKIKVYRINRTLVTFSNNGRSSNILARILALRDIFKILKSGGISINIIPFIFKRYSEKIKQYINFIE